VFFQPETAKSFLIRSYSNDVRLGVELMEIIMDEIGADLNKLLGNLRVIAPDLWRSSERRFILPQRLEDLEKPEYLLEIKEKIQKMKRLKDMLDAGSITDTEYISLRDKILLKV
jgi:hypothetical protein